MQWRRYFVRSWSLKTKQNFIQNRVWVSHTLEAISRSKLVILFWNFVRKSPICGSLIYHIFGIALKNFILSAFSQNNRLQNGIKTYERNLIYSFCSSNHLLKIHSLCGLFKLSGFVIELVCSDVTIFAISRFFIDKITSFIYKRCQIDVRYSPIF